MEYIVKRTENPDELYHYGVKGMKWGKRKARGHAGPGKYITRKRQLAGDKKDLETLNNGGHLSVGFTKKRQAAFDKRDRKVIENRIEKNEKKFSENGSEKSVKKLNKFLDADKKYGHDRTKAQDKRVNKLYKKYDKSLEKDIVKAIKKGDTESINKMMAGRTYLKTMMDSNYLSQTVSNTAVAAKVPVGKNFAYNFLRDNSMGGVRVTVNGHSENYTYIPDSLQKKLK